MTTRKLLLALPLLAALLAGCHGRTAATPAAPAVAPAPAASPATSLLALGKQAFRAGQYDQAEAAFSQLFKQRPNLLEAEFWLGQCALQQKQYAQAATDFRDVATRAPKSATAWLGLGQAYEALQRSADAATCYRTALGLDPRSEPARQGFLRTGHPKKIAITIDDGPSLVYTMRAIAAAERYGGRVTFFCEGVYCSRDAQIIRQMQAHGDEIQGHFILPLPREEE